MEISANLPDLTESPFGDRVPYRLVLRMLTVPERLDQQHVVLAGCLDHLSALVDIDPKGFLAENMLSRFGGFDRPLVMHAVRQRIVYGVDIRVRQKLLVGAVVSFYPEPFREFGCFFATPAGNGEDTPGPRLLSSGYHMQVSDAGCAEYAPVQFVRISQ